MFRLSARQSGDSLAIWLFDDHSEDHGGDHNASSYWEDLLEGASVVSVQAATVTRDPSGKIISQGPWVVFTVSLDRPGGVKNISADIAGVPRDREYLVRFSIDGGPWLGPVSFRWPS